MSEIDRIFGRLSKQRAHAPIDEVVDEILRPGSFGIFGVTGSVTSWLLGTQALKPLFHELDKAQFGGNGDGKVDIKEFKTAARFVAELTQWLMSRTPGDQNVALSGMPSWNQVPKHEQGSLSVDDIKDDFNVVLADILQLLPWIVDAKGIAKVVMAIGDADTNGQLTKAEFESLVKEIEAIPRPSSLPR